MYIIVDYAAPESAYGPYVTLKEAVDSIAKFATDNDWSDAMAALRAPVDPTNDGTFHVNEDAYDVDLDMLSFGFNDLMAEYSVGLYLSQLDPKPFLVKFLQSVWENKTEFDDFNDPEQADAFVDSWLIDVVA